MLIKYDLWAQACKDYGHVDADRFDRADKLEFLREAIRSTDIDHGALTRDFFDDFKLACVFWPNMRRGMIKLQDEMWAVYEHEIVTDGEEWLLCQEQNDWADYRNWLKDQDDAN